MHKRERVVVIIAGALLLLMYHAIFHVYFPTGQGKLGHDYALFLPKLLDGYFWYHVNGLWAVPWFTPAFCGGIPLLPDPQSIYYSVPQFLSFVTDPLLSVYLTFVGFAGIGLVGCYALLRGTFGTSPYTALFGAGLFLFNGFYAHRMLIGHLTYHAFMLVPLIAHLLLRHPPGQWPTRRGAYITDAVLAGTLMAYMFHAGMVNVILPAIGSIVVIGLIYGMRSGQQGRFWQRLGVAGMVACGLSLAKLAAAMAYLHYFGRDAYPLPGAQRLADLLWLIFRALFIAPAHELAMNTFVNVQWVLERHELEYGVTFVPLLILFIGTVTALRHWTLLHVWRQLDCRQWLRIVAIAGLLLLPLLLNYYTPAWNTFLKQVPILKNSTSLVRWISLYIPVVIVLAALTLEKTACLRPSQPYVMVLSLAVTVFLNSMTDRDYYHAQSYDPQEVVQASLRVQRREWSPVMSHIAVFTNSAGQLIMPAARNDVLTQGNSQLLCYEPLFGYRLEAFPRQTLHPGPVIEASNGRLNLKHPACYVYPAANNCSPGDHFSIKQYQEAEAFVHYHPVAFRLPHWQHAANLLTMVTLGGVVGFLGTAVIVRCCRP
jgi:hypothetical protein